MLLAVKVGKMSKWPKLLYGHAMVLIACPYILILLEKYCRYRDESLYCGKINCSPSIPMHFISMSIVLSPKVNFEGRFLDQNASKLGTLKMPLFKKFQVFKFKFYI